MGATKAPSTRRAPGVAGPCALLAVLLTGACSASAGPEAPTASSTSSPPPLTAVLYQSRMDLDDRQVQVRLHNAGDTEVVVERMTLTSTGFEAPMTYRKRGSALEGGRTVDMPVVLSEPVCGGPQPTHTAEVDYRLEDGTTGTLGVEAVDEHGAVATLHTAECFASEVSQVATLTVREAPRVVPRDGVLAAELVVDVTAGAGSGDLTIEHVANTTLLQHADEQSLEPLTEGRELGVRAPEAGTTRLTLTLVPSRCDAHALAEDKQGTRWRIQVELDGEEGQVSVPSPDPVKVALHDFVRRACGLRDDSTP